MVNDLMPPSRRLKSDSFRNSCLREQKGSLNQIFRRLRGLVVRAIAFQTLVPGSNLPETSFFYFYFLCFSFLFVRTL